MWDLHTLKADKDLLIEQIKLIGADPYARKMWEKGIAMQILLKDVVCGAANILKQDALSSGADAITTHGAVNCSVEKTDVLLLGTVHSIRILASRLKRQAFFLPELGVKIEELIDRTYK